MGSARKLVRAAAAKFNPAQLKFLNQNPHSSAAAARQKRRHRSRPALDRNSATDFSSASFNRLFFRD
jgi:hypothetical protein